jgi:hypothetical protein
MIAALLLLMSAAEFTSVPTDNTVDSAAAPEAGDPPAVVRQARVSPEQDRRARGHQGSSAAHGPPQCARARAKEIKLRLQLDVVPPEFVINEDNGQPYDENAYRHWVTTTRTLAAFGFLDRDTPQAAIARAERLADALTAALPTVFRLYPIEEDQDKAIRARMVDGRNRALAEWMAKPASELEHLVIEHRDLRGRLLVLSSTIVLGVFLVRGLTRTHRDR